MRISAVLIAMLLSGAPALGTPYTVNYEGEDFPENEGWQRFTTGGGATRTLDSGVLRLEAMNPSPDGGSDQYLFDREEMLNADAGEMFYAEWRMRLLPGSDSSDVDVFIATDGAERAYNSTYSDTVYASSRDNQSFQLITTDFHTYRLESINMVDYSMFIDNALVWDGFFGTGTSLSSDVVFGDGGVFGASGSEWDYFRFGVVTIPAPGAMPLFVVGIVTVFRKNQKKRRPVRHVRACDKGVGHVQDYNSLYPCRFDRRFLF